MAANVSKKGVEFRLSKKVAELTQVIHLLFKKNHEGELELEALKEAYEYEIDLVIADAKSQIDELKRQLDDRGEELLKQQREQLDHKEEDQRTIQALESQLKDGRLECQNIRDLLIHSQKDIATLRTLNEAERLKHSEETRELSQEIDRLRAHISDLDRLTKFKDSHLSQQADSLRRVVEKLQGEVAQLGEELGNSENLRETLTMRNKHLEEDVKSLKRELARRASLPDVDTTKQLAVSVSTDGFSRKPNYEREIQRLKQEIQRYRMELNNRELNFNRRFADAQPIIVNRRPTSGLSSSTATIASSMRNGELDERAIALSQVRRHFSEGVLKSSVVMAMASPSSTRPLSSTSDQRLPELDSKHPIRRLLLAKPQPSKPLTLKKSR